VGIACNMQTGSPSKCRYFTTIQQYIPLLQCLFKLKEKVLFLLCDFRRNVAIYVTFIDAAATSVVNEF